MNKTYIIDCEALDTSGAILGRGKVEVKNQPNELSAKLVLQKAMAKRFPKFHKIVIKKCEEDFMGIFGQIFGNKFK
jgi:hypothetical protein